MNLNKVIEENILRTLNSILENLSKKKDPTIDTIIKKIRNTMNILKTTPRPPIPTRRYIDVLSILIKHVIRLKSITSDYVNGNLMIEDLYKAVREYEDKVYLYSRISAKERMKTHTYMMFPTIVLGLTIVYATTLPTTIFTPTTIGIAIVLIVSSMITIRYSILASNSLTALASLILLLSIIKNGVNIINTDKLFLATIYVLALATSLSYAHISHLTTSKTYLKRIDETLKQLLKERPLYEKTTHPVELEKSLREIYRKLYGSKGEEYLSYRLTVLMMMKNMSREEALKKLYDEVKEINVG